MALYDPVNGVYQKVSKKYDPVDGVYRKVTKAYDPVDGVYRQYFSSGKTILAGRYFASEYFNPTALKERQDFLFTSDGTYCVAMEMDFSSRTFKYYSRYTGFTVFNDDDRSDDWGWQDEAYREINISSDQAVSEDFYNWFMANWEKW